MSDEQTGIVYGLTDPRKPRTVRYVGQTLRPLPDRLASHLSAAPGGKLPVHRWIREIRSEGVRPHIAEERGEVARHVFLWRTRLLNQKLAEDYETARHCRDDLQRRGLGVPTINLARASRVDVLEHAATLVQLYAEALDREAADLAGAINFRARERLLGHARRKHITAERIRSFK